MLEYAIGAYSLFNSGVQMQRVDVSNSVKGII